MKTCASCHLSKELLDFPKSKASSDGYYSYCRACCAIKAHATYLRRRESHLSRQKEWYEENKEARQAKIRSYNEENKERLSIYQKEWVRRPENKERRRKARASWPSRNPDLAVQRELKRRREDPGYRMLNNLRGRIGKALKRGRNVVKVSRTIPLTGCTKNELMIHLEKQFREGMSWENYGSVWHVDHIKPCCLFDMLDPEQQKVCFHFSNLQPLFAAENLRKERGRYSLVIMDYKEHPE